MRDRFGFGIFIGLVLSLLSWNAHRSAAPHLVSIFPDLATLAALPILVIALLLFKSRQRGVRDRITLRRFGFSVVVVAAIVFAVFSTILGEMRYSHPGGQMLPLTFAVTAVLTLAIGILSTLITVRLMHKK